MSGRPFRLRLSARSTLIELDDDSTVTLPVGPAGLAHDCLRHDPPTPVELERAIDLVEDAIGGLDRWPEGARRLVTADTVLLSLPGLDVLGGGLTREEVEALFQRLASRALGLPLPTTELPHGREVAAALLILRECMHHLGFGRIDPSTD
jgi:hypothetical protein